MKGVSSLICAALALGGLGGCDRADGPDTVHVSAISDNRVRIDPMGAQLGPASATMRAAVAKGLVALDPEGRIVPALAARWIVTDDGLSYIFRLRDHQWPDGSKVTSDRIAELLRARIKELRGSRLGDDVAMIADVRSMTGRVIEIELRSAQPNFLQLLAQPEFGLFYRGKGAGPMIAQRAGAVQQLSPYRVDAETAEADAPRRMVYLRAETAAMALARYKAGMTDIVLNGHFQHLPLIDAAGISTNDLRLDPVAGLFGFLFVRADGFWSVADNRKILAMAIDRPALLTSFSVSAWRTRLKIVPDALDVEGINARPDWASLNTQEARAAARTLVSNWQAKGGELAPLALYLPPGPGSDIMFARVRHDLNLIGLEVKRVNSETEAQARLIDEIAPYDEARWFLSRLNCRRTRICSPKADELAVEARASQDIKERAKLFAEAEVELVKSYNYIPIAVPIRFSLARTDQPGIAENPRGWHPLNFLIGVPIS